MDPKIHLIADNVDTFYNAYHVKVKNMQQRLLYCAAENCLAWIELDSEKEAYQLNWAGGSSEVTLNVGDTREAIFCARGNKTGEIVIPRADGDYTTVGDGKTELSGKIRVTCRNGKRVERRISIKPVDADKLQIEMDAVQEVKRMSDQTKNQEEWTHRRQTFWQAIALILFLNSLLFLGYVEISATWLAIVIASIGLISTIVGAYYLMVEERAIEKLEYELGTSEKYQNRFKFLRTIPTGAAAISVALLPIWIGSLVFTSRML
jgi:hypothetical protein